jgi:16S rRNA (guanine527-N7)-methyltransferase
MLTSAMNAAHHLISGAAGLNVELTSEHAQTLLRLLDELDDWNQRINLTAIRDREQQVTKHLLDSLSVHRYLRGVRIADIGTGAGFPGLPLALLNPGKQFTLIDATAKKLRFVEHAATVMGITNVTVLHARAESHKPDPRYDCLVSRALGSISPAPAADACWR